jgi:hypothetical protein
MGDRGEGEESGDEEAAHADETRTSASGCSRRSILPAFRQLAPLGAPVCEVSFDHLALGAGVDEPTARGVDRRELTVVGGLGAEPSVDREVELAPAAGDELLGALEDRRGAVRRSGGEGRGEGRTCALDELGGPREVGGRAPSGSDRTRELPAPHALVARAGLADGA